MKRKDDPNQTHIDWGNPLVPAVAARNFPDPIKLVSETPPALVQRLRWDFKTSFPHPTEEAIEAGVIDEHDYQPENLRSLHENYTRQCVATLRAIDVVLAARRTGIDPGTGKVPTTHAAKERLRKYLQEEPGRLEHAYQLLIETYEDAFGPEAAQAFSKAICARLAGIPVVADAPAQTQDSGMPAPKRRERRVVRTLPVRKPLPGAIAAGHFGRDDNGKPVNPPAAEVRTITENHAERIIELLQGLKIVERSLAASPCGDEGRLQGERNRLRGLVTSAVELYAGSFGREAAERLEAYARRQVLFGDKVARLR